MKQRVFLPICWIVFASMSLLAQETLYPVRENSEAPTILTADHFAIVAEKSFEYKLTLGFPGNDNAWYFPNTRTRIVVLSLRIQNLSQHSITFDATKFSSTDEEGKTHAVLSPADASERIIAGTDGTPITKTLRGISLGRVANKAPEDQVREDLERYSLHSGQISAGSIAEGLIFFERPQPKKFKLRISLGDLWSKPFTFSTEKQK